MNSEAEIEKRKQEEKKKEIERKIKEKEIASGISKKEAKERIEAIVKNFNVTFTEKNMFDALDDGYDSQNYGQRNRYRIAKSKVNSFKCSVLDLNVSGIDCNELWNSTYPNYYNDNYPEDVLFRTQNYVDKLLELCS